MSCACVASTRYPGGSSSGATENGSYKTFVSVAASETSRAPQAADVSTTEERTLTRPVASVWITVVWDPGKLMLSPACVACRRGLDKCSYAEMRAPLAYRLAIAMGTRYDADGAVCDPDSCGGRHLV